MTLDEREERGRGVLSPADRQYLTDPDGYVEEKSRQAAQERKEATRQRVRDGLLDLALLFEHLPAEELRKAFGGRGWMDPDEELDDQLPDSEVGDRLPPAVAFLYLVASDHTPAHPEDVVEDAIRRAERRRGYGAVEVDLEIDRGEIHRLAALASTKMEQEKALSNAQVRAALEYDGPAAPAPDELAEYLRREQDVGGE